MTDLQLRLAAITDEFSPTDLEAALVPMHSIGMTGAELRVVFGKNIMDLTDDEVMRAKELCAAAGVSIIGIASPILKCVLPGGPAVDTRFQQDSFNAKHSFDDQQRLLDRAFRLCEMTGAQFIRVFSYWRTVEPSACFDAVVEALDGLAKQAAKQGVVIGIENEHACQIGTAAESRAILDAVQHPNLKLVWDPANALVAGENPYPYGYGLLPVERIAHVHVKDCHMEGHTPAWGPVGTRHVDWKGQIAALVADGYRGYLSLETHWAGPDGNKMLGSTICGWNMRGLSAK